MSTEKVDVTSLPAATPETPPESVAPIETVQAPANVQPEPVAEISPVYVTPAFAPSEPANPHIKQCRHCGGEMPVSLKQCPGCGKYQTGAPRGQRAPRAQNQTASAANAPATVSPSSAKHVPTDKQIDMVADAMAAAVEFGMEDIAAPLVLRGRAPVPAFGEKRAARIGAAWAPLLAPYLSGPFILILLAVAVTVKGLGSYIRELRAAVANAPAKQTVEEKKPLGAVQNAS